MKLGLVGLGKMGGSMAQRLMRGGHEVVVSDISAEALEQSAKEGATPAKDLAALVEALETPKVVWLMIPSGDPTEKVAKKVLEYLSPGDILVDGANSNWQDSLRRAQDAEAQGIHYVDAGVSGGVWGLEEGYNLMVGGSEEAFGVLEPALKTLAQKDGYAHVGPAGSGHFVKMVHNGIEYALMQAYGEGFQAMASFPHAEINLKQVADLWQNGAVVRSWLLELAGQALGHEPRLENIAAYVDDSGMGRWTVDFGVANAIPMPAISAALYARFASRDDAPFAAKLVSALRNEFGGHDIKELTGEE